MLVCRLPCVVLCLLAEFCPTLCDHTDCEVVLKKRKRKTGKNIKAVIPWSMKKKQTWFRCNGRRFETLSTQKQAPFQASGSHLGSHWANTPLTASHMLWLQIQENGEVILPVVGGHCKIIWQRTCVERRVKNWRQRIHPPHPIWIFPGRIHPLSQFLEWGSTSCSGVE